ncbi:hypothetical protein LG302_01030 [Halomonas organivorans]
MARQYKTGLIITGDASGGIKAIQATEKELKQLNQGFDKGSRRARRFGQDANETGQELEFLRSTAMNVGAAIAGVFAVSSLAGQARMVAETDALARSLEVSTGELQAWQYAGEQVGIQGEKMADIFKDASEKIGDFARTGGGEAADLIEQMGLNVRELLRLSPDQQLLRIGEALQNLSPSERTTFLESLADDAVRLQPLLENNAEALREYIEEARRLGVAMDQADIEAVVRADRAMQQLSATSRGLSNQLLADLGPGLSEITGDLADFIQQAGGAEEVLGRVGQIAGTLATVYLARRLGPGLLSAGAKGLTMGRNIATGLAMATGATGPLNRALVVTQGRIAATAAAGRAMSASLALVGGPAGAAVLAAGAIYTFRDELGLTQQQIGLTEEELSDLNDELDDMSDKDLGQSIESLNDRLEEATLKAAMARDELAKLRAEDDGYSITGVGNLAEQVERINALGEAQRNLRRIEQELAASRHEQGTRSFKTLDEWLFETKTSSDEASSSTRQLSLAAREAARSEEHFARSLAALEKRLFPVEAAQRDLQQSQILLQAALLKGEISIGRYLEAWERLQASAMSDESWQDVYGFTGKAADGVDQISDAARDLGFTLESAFENAVIKGEGLRSVLGGIAEDIARITLRETVSAPIAGMLSSTIGGMFSGGGLAGPGAYNTSAGGFLGSLGFGGGRRTGGPVEPGKLYEINENGAPEVLRQGGRQYLLPGTERGRVIPAAGPPPLPGGATPTAAGGPVTIQVHAPVTVQAQPGTSNEDAQRQGRQAGRALKGEVLKIIQEQQRPGGILSKGNSG